MTTGEPALIHFNLPEMQAAARAYEKGWGATPVFTRGGGSIPIVADFDSLMKIPVVMMGYGLDTDGLHATNEHYSIEMFQRGIETAIVYLMNLAAVTDADRSRQDDEGDGNHAFGRELEDALSCATARIDTEADESSPNVAQHGQAVRPAQPAGGRAARDRRARCGADRLRRGPGHDPGDGRAPTRRPSHSWPMSTPRRPLAARVSSRSSIASYDGGDIVLPDDPSMVLVA